MTHASNLDPDDTYEDLYMTMDGSRIPRANWSSMPIDKDDIRLVRTEGIACRFIYQGSFCKLDKVPAEAASPPVSVGAIQAAADLKAVAATSENDAEIARLQAVAAIVEAAAPILAIAVILDAACRYRKPKPWYKRIF